MKRVVTLLAALALALGLTSVAGAAGHVERVVDFDPEQFQFPEGVAVDKVGNVYASLAPLGQLVKVAARGDTAEPVGDPIPLQEEGDNGLLGLAVDAPGNVYAAVQSATESNGVWKYDRKTGAATQYEGTQDIGFPNDVAFDKRGNLYVTDSSAGFAGEDALGGIWRIDRSGNVEPWLVDTALGGTGDFVGIPIGANGIEYRQGTLYVANTDRGQVLSVKINRDGSPGAISLVAEGGDLVGGPDGLALDVRGNIYVAVISASTVVRINTDGSTDVIATADDGIDWAASIAFGTGKGERRSLYAVNFAIGPLFNFPPGAGPAIVKIDTDTPGQPLP